MEYNKTNELGQSYVGEISPSDIPIEVRDKHYVHNQDISTIKWYVQHNLGKFPSVQIFDTQGVEWECDLVHTDNNNLEISIGFPLSGKAICN